MKDANGNHVLAYMVRCKCGVTGRIEAAAHHEERTIRERGLMRGPGTATFRTIKVLVAPLNDVPALAHALQNGARCWACNRWLKISLIDGKVSDVHECNTKCMASKGPSCECSCGGTNHGRSWAA